MKPQLYEVKYIDDSGSVQTVQYFDFTIELVIEEAKFWAKVFGYGFKELIHCKPLGSIPSHPQVALVESEDLPF